MKTLGWIILAVILIPAVIYISYNAGYIFGAGLAETENRAEEAE